MSHYDHIIVGGGILGASIAYHISKKSNDTILVLERNDFASGASSRSAGLVLQGSTKKSNIPLAKKTVEVISQLEYELGESVEYHETGSLRLASSAERVDELNSMIETASLFDVDVSVPSDQDINKMAPWLNQEEILKAAFFPSDGYLDSYRLTWHYLKAAKNNGVKFNSNLAATEVIIDGSKICGIDTANGKIFSPNLILAGGVWTSLFASKIKVPIATAPVRSHYWLTEPDLDYGREGSITIMPDVSAYTRPELGGLLLGVQENECAVFDARKLPEDLQYFSPTLGEDHWDILLNSYSDLSRFFPKIESANFSSYISGLSSYTPDGEIILGPIPEIDGLYVAAGDCGSGVSLSGGIGFIISEIILDGKSDLYSSSFKPNRFGKVDPFDEEFLNKCAMARSKKSRKMK